MPLVCGLLARVRVGVERQVELVRVAVRHAAVFRPAIGEDPIHRDLVL
jgi:hypothetical protein